MALQVLSSPSTSGTSLTGTQLQGSSSGPYTSTVGAQALSPTSNLKAPSNTLPSSQIAPKDLSSTYANLNGTIFNKQSNTAFSNQQDFFKDSGLSSFDNVKFDTAWNPNATTTIYGGSQLYQKPAQLASSNPNPAPTGNTSGLGGTYTPPNSGVNGISQGGLIGNLVSSAQTQNPNYTAALDKVNKVSAEQKALEQEAANADAQIQSRPMGLTQQTGQQGILAKLLASKEAALAPEYNAAVAALGAANTQTSNTNSALSTAGGLNSPQFISPGQVQINPSQPGSGMVGVPPQLLQVYAQMLSSGQGQYIPASVTGNTALMAQLYQMAGQPNLNVVGANVGLNTDVYKQYGQQAYSLATTLNSIKDITNQTFQAANGNQINPFTLAPANAVLSDVKRLLSSTGQANFDASIAGLKNQLTAMYASSGGGTPTGFEDRMNQMTNGTMQLGTFLSMINTDAQNGQTILNNVLKTAGSAQQGINNGSINTNTSNSFSW